MTARVSPRPRPRPTDAARVIAHADGDAEPRHPPRAPSAAPSGVRHVSDARPTPTPVAGRRRSSSARATSPTATWPTTGHGAPARQHRGHGLHRRRQRYASGSKPRTSRTATARWGRAPGPDATRSRATTTGMTEDLGLPRLLREGRAAPGRRDLVLLRPRGMARRRCSIRTCAKVGGCGAGLPQGRWLAADLAASDATCTLAILHHAAVQLRRGARERSHRRPVLAGPLRGRRGRRRQRPRPRLRAVRAPGPGRHEDRARGIREFVVGTGGAELRPFEDAAPNSELRAVADPRRPQARRSRGSYDWTFIPTGGDFRDAGSGPCH